MEKHLYLIINTHAGSGNGQKAAAKLKKQLKLFNIKHSLYYTEYAGHEKIIVQELAKKILIPWEESMKESGDKPFPLLVVMGGDGTLHCTVNALYEINPAIPIAYLPCGSGNDFARGAGINRQIEKALSQLLRADQPQKIQVMKYSEKVQDEKGLAVNNIGVGLDAAIVQAANDSATKQTLNKFNMGSFSYLFSILKVLFTQKGFPILIDINGQTLEYSKAFLCTVTNHPYFGGGVAIAPTADPKKPVLDLVLVERINIFKIFWLIFLLIRQKHMNSKHLHHYQSSKFRIISTVPEYVHADGEILGKRNLDITYSLEEFQFWFTDN
ncbi:diacylglycerol kinase family lipid kinase [Enterococcus sp. BWB1-3]|uniref:diacylglycerol/lipid kinase family protein n=1 Tax=Enterococcus sp. BWB1-3 TaxID=2787713 RepID=UPI0019206816|nr:diacylglycerol kinase family protein [Enterococcus sp. BWB1-3]MBL1229794.1 diacylglycerol kinase family lipid kinase [Enterococcus sp. BWB1-3]